MPGFDVFLSHKSSDKPAIRALKQALADQGLDCWLDEEQLRPGLPLFLGNRTWVDLRAGIDRKGVSDLIWGVTGQKPGERAPKPAGNAESDSPLIPNEAGFLDEVFELLYSHSALILLAQYDRDRDSSLEALRQRSLARFGAERVLYLVPSRTPDASEEEFFRVLGRRAGLDPPVENAADFEAYLERRLLAGERLFLLIIGLAHCSDEGRKL